MAEAHGSIRAIFFALWANLGIAVAKTAAAVYTNSGAMLAEAIHSAADSANQLLLLIGLKRARKPVSAEHPLGYGKAIYFWSFVVALLLFSLGGMFSIYEGIHKLQHPEMSTSPWVAVAVLAVAILLEFASLRTAMQEVARVRGQRGFLRWFRTSRQSELIVVVGEDIAALAGLVLALAAVLTTMVTGNPLYDALGTIAIGAVLILVAIAVGVEVKSLLIGESADPETVSAIRAFLKDREEIAEVYRLITLQLGSEVMVAIKARLRERESAARLIRDINRVEQALQEALPSIRWVFFEPDVKD